MNKKEPEIFRECGFSSTSREPIFREAVTRCGAGVSSTDFLFLTPYKIESGKPNILLLELVSNNQDDIRRFWKAVEEIDEENRPVSEKFSRRLKSLLPF